MIFFFVLIAVIGLALWGVLLVATFFAACLAIILRWVGMGMDTQPEHIQKAGLVIMVISMSVLALHFFGTGYGIVAIVGGLYLVGSVSNAKAN